ncbi:hypothetical protein HDU83_008405 [Entophlyctis luteolus]|nr:hypothetical protein HDU83_008405 [Entophlyctis luteolus]
MSSLGFDIHERLSALDAASDKHKQEQLLFQWLASVERDLRVGVASIKASDPDAILGVEKSLLRFLNCTAPRPSRPIREAIARIYILIYTHDPRTLSDTVAGIQNILSLKKLDDPAIKLAATYCLGFITEHLGSKVSYLFAETSNILLKSLKTLRDSEIAAKHETIVALSACLRGAGKSMTEVQLKDLVKFGKTGLTDKAPLIRSDSANMLENLYRHTSVQKPSKIEEFDAFISPAIKGIEGANSTTRISISKFIGFLVSTSQTKVENSVKANGNGAGGKNEVGGTEDEGVLSLEDMFNLLQGYFVKSTSLDVRVGIVQFYAEVLRELGLGFIETNYARIVKHLTMLVGLPKFSVTDADGILHRHLCTYLIRDVLGKTLSESGQIMALRELESRWLKKWSSLFGPESPSSKWVLTFILDEISALLIDLGSASSVVADALSESLFNLLIFPSAAVNSSLSSCMKIFCNANPKALSLYIDKITTILQKDSLTMTGEKADTLEKFVGYSNALAMILSAVKNHQLNTSFESLALIFGLSTQLLKASASAKDPRVAYAQAQMAWNILAGMTTLGPTIMIVHMSQLLLLWKQVFPKSLSKEVTDSEKALTLSLINRDGALSCISVFLQFNSSLVTIDIAKRLAVLLNNALSCSTSIRASSVVHSTNAAATPAQKRIQELEMSVRKRMFDCCLRVKPTSAFDSSFVLLLKTTASVFSPDYEVNMEKSGQDKSAGSPDLTILTSLFWKEVEFCGKHENRSGISVLSLRDFDVQRLEQFIEPRVFGSFENDLSEMLCQDGSLGTPVCAPMPTNIGAVDSAIQLFALLFPIQNAIYQDAILDQFAKVFRYSGGKMSAARKLSVTVNILLAIMFSLKSVAATNSGFASEKVPEAIRDLVMDLLASPNPNLRALCSEILGLLSRIAGAAFINGLMETLIEKIRNNRTPESRAGCALAMGCIHSNAGMAVGVHLETTVGYLNTLSCDAHPLVHTWALYSLCLAIESASIGFSPSVTPTLTMVIMLAMSDSHDCRFNVSSNVHDNNSAVFPLFGKILYALLGVLGPELASSTRTRELCLSLFELFKNDTDPYVVAEAIRCIQQFIMFAPNHVDIPLLLPFLQDQISNKDNVHLIKKSAVQCLYQLTQRDSGLVLQTSSQMEEQCFSLLDTEVDENVCAELRDILTNLLKYVATENPSRWIDLCKNILARGGGSSGPAKKSAAVVQHVQSQNDDDDDDAAKAVPVVSSETEKQRQSVVLIPRWRTQRFCIACIRNLIRIVLDTGTAEHIDLVLARQVRDESPDDADFLSFRLADLVAISFNSATMPVKDLQMEGLHLLQDILNKFSSITDPDFEGHALLEQYQAQITAALTPAFSSESTPELMSLATVVAGTYIGSGIVKVFHPSDRVLRLLGGALDSCKQGDSFLPGISPNEKQMLKLSVLTSWAILQLSSLRFQGSNRIIKDRVEQLAVLWVSAVRSVAEQKVEIDLLARFKQAQRDGGAVAAGDIALAGDMYIDAMRHVLGASYERSWLTIVEALCSLLSATGGGRELLVDRVFGGSLDGLKQLLVVMLGLCVEYVANFGFAKSASAASGPANFASEQDKLNACLKCIATIAASKILDWDFFAKDVFFDLYNVFDRFSHMDNMNTQAVIIDVVREICVTYHKEINSEKIYLAAFKLILNVFVYNIPHLSTNPTAVVSASQPVTPAAISLFQTALDDYVLILKSSGLKYKPQQMVHLLFFIFAAILSSEKFSGDVGPKVLALTKVVLETFGNQIDAALVHSTVSSLLDTCESWKTTDKAVVKNSLLGIALIVTVTPELCLNSNLHERMCVVLFELISSNEESLARIALQCTRSFIGLAIKDAASEESKSTGMLYVRSMIPALHGYLDATVSQLQENDVRRPLMDDIAKALILPCVGLPGAAMSVIVSFLLGIRAVEHTVLSGLLQLASQQQQKFREMMAFLPAETKTVLEAGFKTLLANGGGAGASTPPSAPGYRADGESALPAAPATGAAPKIALKTFGSF